MAEYEAGREASILQDIIAGRKSVEMRLDRGKFSKFMPGDIIHLREDAYEDGEIVESRPNRAMTQVVEVRRYPSFRDCFEAEGFADAIPSANSIEEAVAVCRQFYSEQDERQNGVLAIHFKFVSSSEGQ